jgi:preprotein translocase subunit SecB
MMEFSLVSSKATYVNLMAADDIAEDDYSVQFLTAFSEEYDHQFHVKFDVTVASTRGYSLHIEFIAYFETTEPMTEEFKQSHLPTVSATAIAYTYLRATISTIILNAGYAPIILPVVNFQAVIQEQQAKKLSEQNLVTH